MGYNEFKEELKERLEESLESSTEVYFDTLKKNNQSLKEILTFRESGFNTVPAIHLKDLYAEYLKNEDMEKVVYMVLEILETKTNIDRKKIMGTWEDIQDKIYVRLINYEWNREMLQNVPHRKFLDLAVVFHVRLGKESGGMATVMIQTPMLMEWGITTEDLCEAAIRNLKKEQYTIKGMGAVLEEILGIEAVREDEICPMYVLTNQELCYGVAGILREDLMKEFADKIQEDFYILPSSIHEAILVPGNKGICVDELKKMVMEINETQVEREERLSNSVYCYNRGAGQIEL